MPRLSLIQPRRGTAAEWAAANPILAAGEMGLETDTNQSKRGDGATTWTALPYVGKWDSIPGKPAVVAEGATQAAARAAIGAGDAQRTDEAWDYAQAGTAVGEAVRTAVDEIAVRNAISATSLSVDGVFAVAYDLDTTPPTAADVGAYTVGEVDSLLASKVSLNGSETLTNKTLTSPRMGVIKDSNGNISLVLNATTNAVNYLSMNNAAAGVELQLAANGADDNIAIWLAPKGTDPVVIRAPSGVTPTLAAGSPDANADLNLAAKGSGVVRINGGEVPTLNNTRTFTSKTISLANNTLVGTLAQFNAALSDADFVSISGVETLSGKTLNAPKIAGGSGVATITAGTGTPEGVVAAAVGSLFIRTDGGALTTLYVKETGTDTNTGWVAK